ncbi:MAG: DUF4870 domain-containing protein [Actinomycetota bacterium]|nr:DUF4870 domain-containing protein [Actinomycetota bacterium]
MTTHSNDKVAQPTSQQLVSNDARNWATLSHLSAFVMFFGIPSLVGPLAMWLLRRDDPYTDYHAKEALNFNISFMIYGFIAAFLIIFLIGLLLLPAVVVTWFVLVIRAAVKTSAGQHHRYPMTLRFVNY